ncbi:MAG TPA: 5'/3'-nucleotidase SurE, partial [Miltoncostaeaceae bacterium]|nr:5'/3'-nucleotidase SurE [Miltoncostaeaceae bacterium]
LKRACERVGRVSVIAPDRNRSAIARGITIHSPLHVDEVRLEDGSPAFATDGTPVDCVRFAMLGLLGDVPDIVVSGINLGPNLGDDITYSGTVAAALEGVLLGWPAIAVSADAVSDPGTRWEGRRYDFAAVAEFAASLVPLAAGGGFPPDVLLNVNAPGRPAHDPPRARVTRLGRRIYNDRLELHATEGTRRRYTIYGTDAGFHPEPGTDFAALEDGEISVTPLHFRLTDEGSLDVLAGLLATGLAAPPTPGGTG